MEFNYLHEICNLKQWKTIPQKQLLDEGYPVYGANGIVGYYSEYNHQNETILLGCRGTCGSVHISKPFSYINGNALCLDNLSESYIPKYVYYFLKSLDYSKIISGSGIPQITQIGLKDVKIPKISIDAQTKIVKELDSIAFIADESNKNIFYLEELIKSRFFEMFGDPISNSKNLPVDLIGNKCFVTKLAGFEYSKYIHYEEYGDVVMVKAQNVKNGKLNYKDLSYISNEVSDSLPRSQLKENDVVMTYIGANIGDVAVIDNRHKYHLAPNVAKISPNKIFFNSRFLCTLLAMMTEYILQNSSDTAKGALNMDRIRKLCIICPDIKEQEEFEKIYNLIDTSISNLEKKIELSYELLEKKMTEYFGK